MRVPQDVSGMDDEYSHLSNVCPREKAITHLNGRIWLNQGGEIGSESHIIGISLGHLCHRFCSIFYGPIPAIFSCIETCEEAPTCIDSPWSVCFCCPLW